MKTAELQPFSEKKKISKSQPTQGDRDQILCMQAYFLGLHINLLVTMGRPALLLLFQNPGYERVK